MLASGEVITDLQLLRRIPEGSFWYLGSAYTKFPRGIDAANKVACRVAARLFKARIPYFAPIPHSHAIAEYGGADPLDHVGWMDLDKPLMLAAHGLIVVRMPTWRDSKGLAQELDEFESKGKIFVYLDPLPEELQ